MKASIALLLSGLAAQQVAAHWDRQATNYNTPGYNNNECTDKQKGGYDWSDLKDGDKPGKYDDFDFGAGWSCSTKAFGKRDHVTKRSFGAKAITNSCGKQQPASFSCDQKKDGFSVTHIDISVDHDADLDFHYKMKDGSVCKQRASCKKDGTTVQNTQCGGAQSVDVYLGNSSEGRDSCNIGVHQIGFDCDKGQSYTPPPPYTPPVTSEAPPSTSSVEVPSSSSVEVPSSSSEVPPPPPETTAPPQTTDSPPPPPESSSASIRTPFCGYGSCGSSGFTNSSTAPPTPPETPSSSPVEVPSSSTEVPTSSAPSGECGGYGQPACETSSAVESTPAVSTPAESSSVVESSPIPSAPVSSAPVNSYNGTVPSSPVSSQPPTVTPPPGGYTPPECLPKCLNTWMKIKSECKDNTDSACYCKIPDLTDNVIDCVKAYGTDEEVKQALSYFVGICAPQIPENPHIIDKCTDVPLAPPTAPVTSAPETPATTAAPEQPQTPGTTPAPAPEQPGSIPCTTITYGSSTYTVPQVGFTTETPGAPGANPTEPIALYPAAPTTPAPAPANPTAPYPVPSGASGFTSVAYPTGTGAGTPPPAAEFSGAASALNVKAGMVFGAAFAFFAM